MGSLLKSNNVAGVPFINIGAAVSGTQTTQANVVQLFNELNTGTTSAGTGLKIGEARLYWFGVSDAPYTGATTEWDLAIVTFKHIQIFILQNLIHFQKFLLDLM